MLGEIINKNLEYANCAQQVYMHAYKREREKFSSINWKFIGARRINKWRVTCTNRLWRKCIRAWGKRTLQDTDQVDSLFHKGRAQSSLILYRSGAHRGRQIYADLFLSASDTRCTARIEGQSHIKSFFAFLLRIRLDLRHLSAVDSLYPLDHTILNWWWTCRPHNFEISSSNNCHSNARIPLGWFL